MASIPTFDFTKEKFNIIKQHRFGRNWPVVYIAENGREAYIGETTNLYSRSNQHQEKEERQRLNNLHVITDEEFNKSAALDIESWLIQYMSADGKFILQNGNRGLQNHNYFDREKYKAKFEIFWQKLLEEKELVVHTLEYLKNTDLFKYSPYKSLSEDQLLIVKRILKDLRDESSKSFIVSGKPGTGKTVLATYLFKYLKEQKETEDWNIGLVIPMTSLRKTLKKVFKNIKGLNPSMVLGPNEVVKKKFDLLIIDEAHRLRRRRNITNYRAFDFINHNLNLGNVGTELDWIKNFSERQLFFYDENQSVRPSDVRAEDFSKMNAKHYTLTSQMRIQNSGEEFVNSVDHFFLNEDKNLDDISGYDFKIYEDIELFISDIKKKNSDVGLSRIVAGYAWPWRTKKGIEDHDIKIGDTKLIWNTVAQDWVNSNNSINEVGCIHTIQGYDLNYVGVIIGPEIIYDTNTKKIIINRNQYFDRNGHAGVTDPLELERYIINIYKTLMTRGIKGCYIYCVNEDLRERLKDFYLKSL